MSTEVTTDTAVATGIWVIRNHPSVSPSGAAGYGAVLWVSDVDDVPKVRQDAPWYADPWEAFQCALATSSTSDPILHEEVQW